MADTIAGLAQLLNLGPGLPQQPPRFAKVTAISGDTVTVYLGSGTADAVRCCDCAVADVVLLETMPSGQLAAVAVKGYSGGGGYVLPVATTTTLGGVIADGSTITVDVDGTIHAALYEQSTSGIWTYRKWLDGTAECWGNYTYTITSWSSWGSLYYSQPFATTSYPAGLFTAAPTEVATLTSKSSDGFVSVRSNTGSNTATRSYFLARPTNGTNNQDGTLSVYAIGRWQ